MKEAGGRIRSLLANPAFGTFVVVLWGYTIAMEAIIAVSSPAWSDPAIWIEFGKAAVKQSLLLFIAILSKVMRMSYQNTEDTTKTEMKTIANACLSLMNKCLSSDSNDLREYALSLSAAVIGQGVSLYDAAFYNKEKDIAEKVASELSIEKKG